MEIQTYVALFKTLNFVSNKMSVVFKIINYYVSNQFFKIKRMVQIE